MPITNITVSGIGGNPPTHIRVAGEVSGCEILNVTSSCTDQPVDVPIPTGGLNQWTVDLPNDKKCTCGSIVQVTVICGLGTPSAEVETVQLALTCDSCPAIVLSQPLISAECNGGKRTVDLTASITQPAGQSSAFQWVFGDGTLGAAFVISGSGSHSESHDYTPGSYSATLKTILPTGCPDKSVTVVVSDCPTCCPTVTLASPQISGCAPGSAVASFQVALQWPEECTSNAPSSYRWTLNGPNGAFQKITSGSATDTTSGWKNLATGIVGSADLTGPGNYSVSVRAVLVGIPEECEPTATQSFQITSCCPTFSSKKLDGQEISLCEWFFWAQVDNPQGAPLTFEWVFHDGTTQITHTPSVSHIYAANSKATGDTTLTLKSPGCPDQKVSVRITHRCGNVSCPKLDPITATPSTGSECADPSTGRVATFNFSANVTNASSVSGGYQWDFGDGQTANTPSPTVGHSYSNPGSFTVKLKVQGPPGVNCPASEQQVTVNISACRSDGDGGGSSINCAVLLAAALLLGILACVLAIIAACTGNAILGVVAGVLAIVALIALIVWLFICARMNCALFNWARWITLWILLIAPVIGIIVAIFGGVICGLIAAIILWGYWGTVLAILDIIGPKIGCPLRPPPWP